MNKVVLIGRLTKDPEIRVGSGENAVAKYTLAVDRKFKRDETDFINCVVFGKQVDFVDKYLRKGTKLAVVGRIQTGSYKNRDGQTVYTTDVVIEEQEFAESKGQTSTVQQKADNDGFFSIPEGINEELPFY